MITSFSPLESLRSGRHGDVQVSGGWASGWTGSPQTAPQRSTPRSGRPINIGFLFQPKFTLLAFAGFVEALRHAAIRDRATDTAFRWTLLGGTSRPIVASCGASITPWREPGEPDEFDYLVVVGGLLPDAIEPEPQSVQFLRRAAASGVKLISLCTGSFVLAEIGLLDGKRCCVHWNHHLEFAARYPDIMVVTGELFVADRGVITCAGGASSIDLAAWLIERHHGKRQAFKTLRHMLTESFRPPNHPQPHFYANLDQVRDLRVRRAVHLLERYLDDPPTIDRLAGAVNLGRRQLERAFLAAFGIGPGEFARRMRLDYAHWLVCNTGVSFTDIALACGFSDGAHLSRSFRSRFDATPRQIREFHQKEAASALLATSD